VWVELADKLEQSTRGGNGLRLPGEYQGNFLGGFRQLGQALSCQSWIPEALDTIVVRVSLAQLSLENVKGLWVLVTGEQHRERHH
jgi:hypothetical protein